MILLTAIIREGVFRTEPGRLPSFEQRPTLSTVSAPPASLTELIAPISVRTLVDHLEGRRLLHLPTAQPERFERLFSWSRLGELLVRGTIETDRFFLFAGGREVDPVRIGAIGGSGRVDVSQVRTLFRQGTTLSLPNVQASFDETSQLVGDIEWQLGERTEIRVIATPSSGTPIPLHFDLPDLLILQVEGEKEWTLFGDPVPGSYRYRTLKERPSDVTGRVRMRRGDVLFVPSGLHHQCRPFGDSLHLVIGIYRRPGMSFVDHVRTLAAEDLGFFDGLPTVGSQEALAEAEAALKRRLVQLVESTSLGEFLQRDNGRLARPRHVALGEPPREAGVPLDALLVPAWSRKLPVPAEGPVRAGSRSFDLAPAARAALERLQAESALPARELVDQLDLRFGSGRGEAAVGSLLDEGLVVAVSSRQRP